MSITVTDAIKRKTDSFPVVPSVSADGKQAFVVYQINVTVENQKAAELFNIIGGKLVSIASYNPLPDTEFSSICTGFATKSFDLFTLVQDNQKEGTEGRFQISTLVYDGTPELKVKNSLVAQAYVPGYTAYGGSFVVTAVVENPLDGDQISSIWLLSRTLEV